MRRLLIAALLTAPLLLTNLNTATANNGPCTFGLGCPGNCLRLFPFIHQHGPLYNYGPYYGYPPFEPYGNWNAYLQYTGPVPDYGGGSGQYGWIHGHGNSWGGGNPHALLNGGWGGGLLHRGGGCATCGGSHGFGGGLLHNRGGCNSCGRVAASYVTSGNATDRFTGFGEPAGSAAYYAETPSLLMPNGVVPVGFMGR